MTYAGDLIIGVFSGIPDRLVFVENGEFYVDTGVNVGEEIISKRLPVYPVSWNLILYGTLLVLSWRRLAWCFKWVLIGFLVLALSHVVYFTVATVYQISSFHDQIALQGGTDIRGFLGPTWSTIFRVFSQSYYLTLGNLLPFLLMAPIWLTPEDARRKKRALREHRIAKRKAKSLTGTVGRNDLCPCGSGRKFKRCCMR